MFQCIYCKKDLQISGKKSITCPFCGHKFSIEQNIPILLPIDLDELIQEERKHHDLSVDRSWDEHQLKAYRNKYFHGFFLDFLRRLPKPAKILEIGSGSGYDMCQLTGGGHRLVASDISLDSLVRLRDMIRRLRLGNDQQGRARDMDVEFVICQGERLPFKDGYFDAVFMIAALHHIIDPQKVLREVVRCVKKGGYVILGIEPSRWFMFLQRLARRLAQWMGFYWGSHSTADEQARGFTRIWFKKACHASGMQIIKIQSVWFLCGVLHYGLEVIYRVFHFKRRVKAPILVEKICVAVDLAIGKIPLVRNFCWHWTVIMKITNH